MFGRYRDPSFIRSDNGPHFANKVIQEFLQAAETKQNLTLAYCSQENGIVERCNKEINRHILAALCFHTTSRSSSIPSEEFSFSLKFSFQLYKYKYCGRTRTQD